MTISPGISHSDGIVPGRHIPVCSGKHGEVMLRSKE